MALKRSLMVLKKLQKTVGKAAKKSGKAAGKAITSNPIFWKILLIVLIVIVVIVLIVLIVAAIVWYVTKSDYDPEAGTLSSINGIAGDKFYGARFIYQDDEAANLEIQDDYLKLTYNILNDTKSQTGLTISLAADYATDENILEITTNYANALVGNESSSQTIDQCINSIDHFGFTQDEVIIVFDSIANTIKTNAWASASVTKIKSALEDKYEETSYQSYKNVTPKIYVWDYILDGKKDTLEKLPRKDYFGFIFMPKQTITMTSASFIFVIDGGYGVDVCLKHQTSGQSDPTPLGDSRNANVTWFYDEHMQDFYECTFNIKLDTFEAIDTNTSTLTTPTSIYTLLENNTYSNYFTQTEDYNGLTLIQNVATSNYIYLELDNKDEDKSQFNFAEQLVEYK